MRFFYIPNIFSRIHRRFIWNIPDKDKNIYLTFDDGPSPEVTPWILDILEKYKAKATFFCVGNNVKKHPELYDQVISGGHNTGNHTFSHVNALKVGKKKYLENISECADYIKSRLFRPPYGKITYREAFPLLSQGYKIVLWSVMSYDFDCTLSSEKILQKSIKHSVPGSIIVFHDNIKNFPTLQKVLPSYLEHFVQLGYGFKAIQS